MAEGKIGIPGKELTTLSSERRPENNANARSCTQREKAQRVDRQTETKRQRENITAIPKNSSGTKHGQQDWDGVREQ